VDFAGDFNAIRLVVEPAECRLAVIGGVALAAYGHPRMTLVSTCPAGWSCLLQK
jgi:hypothetical protein